MSYNIQFCDSINTTYVYISRRNLLVPDLLRRSEHPVIVEVLLNPKN
ncbi:unnamed protein product, partial [Oppiella nova]